LGYRLTGDRHLDSLCCVHHRAADRAIVISRQSGAAAAGSKLKPLVF